MDVSLIDSSRGADVISIVVTLASCVLGFFAGWLVKVQPRGGGATARSILGGVQGASLALGSAVIARLFLWLLLIAVDDDSHGDVVLGHLIFLLPAVVDDLISLGGERVLTTPAGLMMLATVVGAANGMMSGIWRIYDWRGIGWLAVLLDCTWGLAGQTYATLLHVINFTWGDHATETATNKHRYARGFALKPGYAFTQGNVMSNLKDPPGQPLFDHESTHVWQNRGFGPFYTLTYIGWMLFWLIPALIKGAITRTPSGSRLGAGVGAERWCYMNCPWEAWAYAVQRVDRRFSGAEMIWSGAAVAVSAVFICGGIVALGVALFLAVS